MMLTLIKIILSIPIGIGLIYPLLYPNGSGGILRELKIFGTTGTVIVVIVFFLLVFLYAHDLVRSLKLVSPSSRTAKPNSVWFMLLLPYNFIEDFFIVTNVARSLEAEAAVNPALSTFKSFGRISGLGWCIAQVVSLLPNEVGSLASGVATVLWIWHWVFIRRVNTALAQPTE